MPLASKPDLSAFTRTRLRGTSLFPRVDKLPVIPSQREVKALLEAPKNLGHRAILATMYGAGLRISEVVNLKVCDIDGDRMIISIRSGKGRRDRQVMLPETLRETLVA